MKQENLKTLGAQLAVLLITLLGVVGASAAESSFYQQFTNVLARGERGFLSDASLVDTNNTGPNLTNGPISFAKFRTTGEIAGIRLGMTMSEVEAVLGKPTFLHSQCMGGPRFDYGKPFSSGATLSFQGDRLVVIGVNPRLARTLVFDNGLNGMMTKPDFERVLGPPNLPALGPYGLFTGEVAYLTNGVRLELRFALAYGAQSERRNGSLFWISVRSEPKPERDSLKPGVGTNAIPNRSSERSKPRQADGQR